ncbi:MAG: DegT/DnrJ/EryC1/StrS family aminotransferase [Planctomycetes bacterium]|nr:DegT/DnrJ/EryC1/StrS family aminotransferase [Planctomycetota bacterium]MBI3832726.1 DegT/DnrJ/EryC1/StrS family aminotransferase [Planctomycetota bacterium]
MPTETFVTPKTIPLARPNITQREIDAIVEVLQTPNLSLGPKVPEFERAFAEYCGTRFAVACSSGTTGLHLLVRAMEIGPGDEVITTPYSFVASSNCVLMEGAKPVFVDIDPDAWDIDVSRIEAAMTPRTKAIIPVDVFGPIADMDSVRAIAQRRKLRVIEDSCEALGTRYKTKMAGSFGDAGVFGFYPNKQLTTGEGGMIVTDDAQVADLCRSMRNQGRETGGGWLAHPRMGYNYRLSDINCALGLAQLKRIREIIAERDRVHALYRERLSDEPRLSMQKCRPGVTPSWFVFVIRLADRYTQTDRDRMLKTLAARGIGCSNYFAPIHLQPFYMERLGHKPGDFPICERVAARTIALPFHHQLSESDIDFICADLRSLL